MNARHFFSLIVAAAALVAGAAQARNLKLLLPLQPAVRAVSGQPGTVPLHFGSATADGLQAAGAVLGHGVGEPYGFVSSHGGPSRDRRSDPEMCLDAFRKAVAEMRTRALAHGAIGIAGVVSFYNGVEMDSREVYECHVGFTRAVVDLKGQAVRSLERVAVPQQQSAVVAAPRAMTQAAVAAPAQPPRIASGYAAIDDIDAIPYLSDNGRAAYREWLGRPTPKAFAISTKGHWYTAWSLAPQDATLPADPNERALVGCERAARMPCKLYAVNGSVVWIKEPR
jgi:hypothetical protein